MRLFAVLFVWVSLSVISVNSFAGEKIRMGYFMLPPHTFNDGEEGPPQGAGITYFNRIAEKMGYEVEWIGPLPLPRLTKFLKTGKVDGTIGFPRFASFEKFLHYTQGTVYMAQPSLGVHADSKLSRITSIDDIHSFRIGFVKSKSGKTTPLIDKNRGVIHLREFHGNKWMEQNIKMVHLHRLDALYDRQEYTMRYVATSLGLGDKIKVLPMPSEARPMFIAFSRNSSKDGKKLTRLCNEVQSEVGVDYNKLLSNEFDKLQKIKGK